MEYLRSALTNIVKPSEQAAKQAAAIGLEYWNSSPNLLVGCMVPSVAITVCGVCFSGLRAVRFTQKNAALATSNCS